MTTAATDRKVRAVLWDVDGVLAETERDGHRVAFNLAFEAQGLAWHWSEERYGELLRITGGRERLMHDMTTHSDAPALTGRRDALARAIHRTKNERYAALVRDHAIPLRDGVLALMHECRARGVRMGIATTTSRVNVDVLLRAHLGEQWAQGFDAIVCGEDVQRKKPDPEVYTLALRALGLRPLDAVAIEDSPGGVAAARAADVPVVVTRSFYFADAAVEGAVAIGPGLHTRAGWRPGLVAGASDTQPVGLDDVEGWCVRMDLVSHLP